jgi:N-acetyl-anhydromuramyl-L-alanine amidase AmpD
MLTPKFIVIHWTGGQYAGAVSWLRNILSRASAHFVVKADASEITQLVPLTKCAWHAGGKSWHPVTGVNLNLSSIGIEIEGAPSNLGLTGWKPELIQLVADLCKWIATQCPTVTGITDHSTILPTMRTDVLGGRGVDTFPWATLVAGSGLIDQSTSDIRQQVRKYFKLT